MVQIRDAHLAFMYEAREAFSNNSVLETYRNEDDFDLIALRMGVDRDCVLIFELGNEVANFVQQMVPKPNPRKDVVQFAFDMENQLEANEHRGGWKEEHWCDLAGSLERNVAMLRKELMKKGVSCDPREVTKCCANIANFAMMIADNEGKHL